MNASSVRLLLRQVGRADPRALVRVHAAVPRVGPLGDADALGNFYTTAALDLADAPTFPFVRAATGGGANLMPFPTSSGACNVCHAGVNPVDLP